MSVNLKPSEILLERICQAIEQEGGWLPFDRFMGMALYEPELGYYESKEVFGEPGDFVTGASLGPWLALGFADLIVWAWQEMGRPDPWYLLEQGGGNGQLLAKLALLLQETGIVMPQFIAVERSHWMRQRQQQQYQQLGLHVQHYHALTDVPVLGAAIMISNELPDAFPVKSFQKLDGKLFERGVACGEQGLQWQPSPVALPGVPGVTEAQMDSWPHAYVSEWNPYLADWQQQLARILGRGYSFCVDYGYSAREYYRDSRIGGTLMGHHQHEVIEDVLANPGQCDITAHVNFSELAEAGQRAGFQTLAWMTQGAWLAQSPGVNAAIQALAQEQSASAMHALQSAKRMMMPFGMGETFKILIQEKGTDACAPEYLSSLDRKESLA